MKRQDFPPEQWSLEQCLERIMDALSPETRRDILNVVERGDAALLHMDLGRWIRNNCGLWEHGTERLVSDIVQAYKSKTYPIPSLDESRFHHPELEFSLEKMKGRGGMEVDASLHHPDNCSWVLIEIVLNELKNENGNPAPR